ncbi:hypothetical protein Trydic_g12949 [Trypoxylus dichotomus]
MCSWIVDSAVRKRCRCKRKKMDNQFVKCDPPPYARLENNPVPLETVLPISSQPTAPLQSQPVNSLILGTSPMMQNFGPKKQIANCPYCNVQITTKVKSKALTKAHCWACIFFFTG